MADDGPQCCICMKCCDEAFVHLACGHKCHRACGSTYESAAELTYDQGLKCSLCKLTMVQAEAKAAALVHPEDDLREPDDLADGDAEARSKIVGAAQARMGDWESPFGIDSALASEGLGAPSSSVLGTAPASGLTTTQAPACKKQTRITTFKEPLVRCECCGGEVVAVKARVPTKVSGTFRWHGQRVPAKVRCSKVTMLQKYYGSWVKI